MRFLLILSLIFSSVILQNLHAQVKIADTIYYNKKWEISEQAVARYYRVGRLSALDNVWYYTGKVKDYTCGHVLMMEGEYSESGIKNGMFTFYYPDGRIYSHGRYKKNIMDGDWYWFYPGGKEKAVIHFESDEQHFSFKKFTDEQGQVTLKDGTGNFVWYTNLRDTINSAYICRGEFLSGMRSGVWNYEKPSTRKETLFFEFSEKYKDGELFKIKLNGNSARANTRKPFSFEFTVKDFSNTEEMRYDDLFNINGDSLAYNNLVYYLMEHRPVEMDLKNIVFDTAFEKIISILEEYTNLNYYSRRRDVDARIEFKVGSKGRLENISVSGNGYDSSEINLLSFILTKFANLEMPGDENVAIEKNFTVYCYVVDLSEIVTGNVGTLLKKEFVISALPKEKMLKYLDENKKTIKKIVRKRIKYIYYYRL